MISYELAKACRDAGLPQEGKGETHYYDGDKRIRHENQMRYPSVYIPTLSELINWCGAITIVLWGCKNHGYYASCQSCNQEFEQIEDTVAEAQGSTPEEAVARLGIAIHKQH